MTDTSGEFWEAKNEEIVIYCIGAPTQADIFLDVISLLMKTPDSRVVAMSFGATVERPGELRYSADVVVSKGDRHG